MYIGSNILSTESDDSIRIGKVWTVFDKLLSIWKSYLSKEKYRRIFEAIAVSVLMAKR